MAYTTDRTRQLEEAHAQSRFGSKASLQAAGVPTRQHNVGVETKKAAAKVKKAPAKKTEPKKSTAKKATAKKSAAKKTASKKS